MRYHSFLLISLFIVSYAYGQKANNRISGTTTDAQNRPLAGTTILLWPINDSTSKRVTVCAEDGKFIYRHLHPGIYQLRATSVGYHPFLTKLTLDSSHGNLRLPVIVLSPNKTNLKEVVVKATAPLIQRKVDRTIVNVDAMIGTAGNSILDVLAKSPGVTVDINGDITLNGKGGVLVLIDDRPTYLSVQELAAYLGSLPAAVLDKLELITTPPAKYEAAGSAVINLQLKRQKTPGINGNIVAGYSQGRYAGANTGANLQYKKKKLSFFSNVGVSGNESYSSEQYQRTRYYPDGAKRAGLYTENKYRVQSKAINGRLGIDYSLSNHTTLGVMVNGTTRPKDDRTTFTTEHRNSQNILDSIGGGYTDGRHQWNSSGLNMNIQHKFTGTGKQLTADLDALWYQGQTDQYAPFRLLIRDSIGSRYRAIRQFIPFTTHIYAAKADYTQPMGSKMRLDAGFKVSGVTTDNNAQSFQESRGVFTEDPAKANHFIYRERMQALYASATRDWKRWAVQGGLRMERIELDGHLAGNGVVKDSTFERNYANIFPTIFVLYKLDSNGNHTLKLSYERRIRRPNYQQFNPFIVYRDQYNCSSGNPYLLPQFNNFVELEYNYKQYFGVSLLYGRVKGVIQSLTRNEENTFVTRPENFGVNSFVNLVTHVNISPVKGWNLNSTLVLFHLENTGIAYGEPVKNEVTTAEIQLNNQITFNKGWSAEVNGFYASTHKGGQTITDPFWTSSFSIQKILFNRKATIRLGLDDIFHTRKTRMTNIGIKDATSNQLISSDTRRIRLAFNYRFGKNNNARKRARDGGGAQEEEGRVN